MIRALGAACILLDTFITIKSSAFKLARFKSFAFFKAVLNAGVTTAVAAVVVTFWFVIFSVARSISNPNIDANNLNRRRLRLNDDLFNYQSMVVPVVDNWWFWKGIKGKTFESLLNASLYAR